MPSIVANPVRVPIDPRSIRRLLTYVDLLVFLTWSDKLLTTNNDFGRPIIVCEQLVGY